MADVIEAVEMGLALSVPPFLDTLFRLKLRAQETLIRVYYFFRQGAVFAQGVGDDVLFASVVAVFGKRRIQLLLGILVGGLGSSMARLGRTELRFAPLHEIMAKGGTL